MFDLIVGCCGWCERRASYFQHFTSVELQDTFYQPPSVALAAELMPRGVQDLLAADADAETVARALRLGIERKRPLPTIVPKS